MTVSNPARDPSWLSGAFAAALPPLLPTLGEALIWGAAMGASPLLMLVLDSWETPQKIRAVAALFALGGFAAFPFALILARFLSHRRSPEVAFASAFLSLALATVCVTGAFYALDYRAYYSEWHADAFTHTWFLQFVHTTAGALYQFAMFGLRLYFPLGFVALLAASILFARRAR